MSAEGAADEVGDGIVGPACAQHDGSPGNSIRPGAQYRQSRKTDRIGARKSCSQARIRAHQRPFWREASAESSIGGQIEIDGSRRGRRDRRLVVLSLGSLLALASGLDAPPFVLVLQMEPGRGVLSSDLCPARSPVRVALTQGASGDRPRKKRGERRRKSFREVAA